MVDTGVTHNFVAEREVQNWKLALTQNSSKRDVGVLLGTNEAKPDSLSLLVESFLPSYLFLLHDLMFFFVPVYYPNAMAVYCLTQKAFAP